MKYLIFWGGTGQAIVLEEFLCEEEYKLIAIFDRNKELKPPFKNVPVYPAEEFKKWSAEQDVSNIYFVSAIAGHRNRQRLIKHNLMKDIGLKPLTAIHPSAYLAKNAKISEGCQIMANSTICARAKIGKCTIVNTAASIDHECEIGRAVHIGPGAHLSGCVAVGDFSFLGTGCTILPRVKIGKNSIIGAGAVVTKDVPDNVVAVGTPAKVVRKNEKK